MFVKFWKLFLAVLLISSAFVGADFSRLSFIPIVQAANLEGRILLQVQDKGQAWYVNPLDGRRYYLGRPADAFAVMRRFGLGISNSDFNKFFSNQAPINLAGRILLKVQAQGEAYYVNPLDRKLYYLGRPADAFALMRRFGLGITTADLNKIISGEVLASEVNPENSQVKHVYNFKYQNVSYSLNLNLTLAQYQSYQSAPHVYSYFVGQEPPDSREAFYALFLKIKNEDHSLEELISQARAIAVKNSWTNDQLAEFIIALVQYISYDQAKLQPGNNSPFYPYETLYLQRGVCADKTFLAVALLRRLGYGAAILDFPDINHTAAGVACPLEYSLNNSGYCFIETTNNFPWSIIPADINGQAKTTSESFDNLFNSAGLGTLEIKQATTGQVYQGALEVRSKVTALRDQQIDINNQKIIIDQASATVTAQEQSLNNLKVELDAYRNNGQIVQYNSLISEYNDLVVQYNSALEVYRSKINTYNQAVSEFNRQQKEFYQFD